MDEVLGIQEAVGNMEESLKPGSVNILLATEDDEEFHLAFYEVAHNKIVESIAGPIITHAMNKNWKRQKRSPKYFRLGLKGHQKIIEGVEKKVY